MYRKKHQHNSIFNCINRNIVYPQLHFSRGSDIETSVEITEINSDDDQTQNENGPSHHREDETAPNSHNIDNEDNYSRLYDNIINYDAIRSIYNEFYNSDLNHNINHHGNGFTFIDNVQMLDSSSEGDTYLNASFNKRTESSCNKNKNPFMEEIISHEDYYDPNEDNMWFHSFKNTSYLSQLNELLNEIDSTGSGSPDVENGQSGGSPRIPTPEPRYVPKLNLPLQPTLSTVDEVTESKPSTSDNQNFAEDELIISKTTNGENVREYEDEQNPLPKSQSNNDFTISLKNRKQKFNRELEEIKFQLEPNFTKNSWCSVIKRIPRDPEIIVSFKPQDNRQFITVEENDSPKNNLERLQKNVWNTGILVEKETLTSYPSITITDFKSDCKKITLVSTNNIGNNELEINTEVCENNISRQDLDTLSDSNSTANEPPTHIDLFESTTEKNADTPSVDYKLSLNLTNSEIQTSWLQKILRCCKGCK